MTHNAKKNHSIKMDAELIQMFVIAGKDIKILFTFVLYMFKKLRND